MRAADEHIAKELASLVGALIRHSPRLVEYVARLDDVCGQGARCHEHAEERVLEGLCAQHANRLSRRDPTKGLAQSAQLLRLPFQRVVLGERQTLEDAVVVARRRICSSGAVFIRRHDLHGCEIHGDFFGLRRGGSITRLRWRHVDERLGSFRLGRQLGDGYARRVLLEVEAHASSQELIHHLLHGQVLSISRGLCDHLLHLVLREPHGDEPLDTVARSLRCHLFSARRFRLRLGGGCVPWGFGKRLLRMAEAPEAADGFCGFVFWDFFLCGRSTEPVMRMPVRWVGQPA
mmetsp:Transcript_9802/g.23678  ORF Transcript_9802/g.23678 Transcript_9802/m.23678 type:complete len:290 (-) Transcript_9802:961-1830(-)